MAIFTQPSFLLAVLGHLTLLSPASAITSTICVKRSAIVYTSDTSTFIVSSCPSAVTFEPLTTTVFTQNSSCQTVVQPTSSIVKDGGFEAASNSYFPWTVTEDSGASYQVTDGGQYKTNDGSNYLQVSMYTQSDSADFVSCSLITFPPTTPKRQVTSGDASSGVFNLSQTISNVPSSAYELTVDAQGSSSGSCALKICLGNSCSDDFSLTSNWVPYSYGSTVTPGADLVLTMVFECPGGENVAVDNIDLQRAVAIIATQSAEPASTVYVTRTVITTGISEVKLVETTTFTPPPTTQLQTVVSNNVITLTTTLPQSMIVTTAQGHTERITQAGTNFTLTQQHYSEITVVKTVTPSPVVVTSLIQGEAPPAVTQTQYTTLPVVTTTTILPASSVTVTTTLPGVTLPGITLPVTQTDIRNITITLGASTITYTSIPPATTITITQTNQQYNVSYRIKHRTRTEYTTVITTTVLPASTYTKTLEKDIYVTQTDVTIATISNTVTVTSVPPAVTTIDYMNRTIISTMPAVTESDTATETTVTTATVTLPASTITETETTTVVTTTSSPTCSTEPFVANPGFETGDALPWVNNDTLSNCVTNVGVHDSSFTEPNTGSYAYGLETSCNGYGTNYDYNNNGYDYFYQQDIPVCPYTAYNLTYWTKVNAVGTGSNDYAYTSAYVSANDGQRGLGTGSGSSYVTDYGVWQQNYASFSTRPSDTLVRITTYLDAYVYSAAPAKFQVAWDDFEITVLGPATDYNYGYC